MQTKDVMAMLYGPESGGYQTRLADIADTLVLQNEEREQRRMAEADLRDALAGQGPMLASLQRALQAEQHEALTDSKLPAVLAFDAYCVMKDASKEQPEDRGLKQATNALFTRWQEEPLGHMTVGELVAFRDQVNDMFPKSAAKRVFDISIPEVGFQTLTNLPYLTRIAADIVDQESYERVIEANGLDGDRPEDWRARAYIKGLASLIETQDPFELRQPTLREATERALAHVAQEMGGHEDPQDMHGDEDAPESMATMEEELPHDENTEEMATIESPVSGEELVIELGVSDEQRPDGMDVEMGGQKTPTSAAMPGAFEQSAGYDPVFSQYAQFAPEFEDKDPPHDAQHDGTTEVMEDQWHNDGMGEGMDGMGDEEEASSTTSTRIVDPTSGQELEMTLSVVDEEEPEHEPGADTDDSAMLNQMDELGGGNKEYKPEEHKASARTSVKAVRLSKDDVKRVCATFGVTPEYVESQVLNGDEVAAGAYAIRIGSGDAVELRKLVYADSTKDARVIRSASLTEFDGVVADFMALTAAQFAPEETPRAKRAGKGSKAAAKSADYELITDVPQGAPINARRMMASVWQVSADAHGEMMDDGRLSVILRSAEERDVNRIQRVLADVFGVANMEARKVKLSAAKAGAFSPYRGKTPVERRPAGAPSAPMLAPVQKVNTGAGAQQDFIKHHTDPMRHAEADPAMGAAPGMSMEGGEHCEACAGMGSPCKKHSDMQVRARVALSGPVDDDMPPEEMPLDEAGGPAVGPGAMDDASTMGGPGMAPPMGGGMPGMQGAPGGGMMGGPLGMPEMGGQADASQVPLDLNSGQLQPEDDEAVRAAMTHFRNMGMLPLEAVDKFSNAYSAMLDKYGDKTSPQRAMAEAAIIRSMAEAFQRPAIIPAKGSGSSSSSKSAGSGTVVRAPVAIKVADMPSPGHISPQQPGKVTVSKKWPKSESVGPAKTPPTQPGPMQGTYSDKNMTGHGDASSHNIGPAATQGGPERGAREKNKGTSKSNGDPAVGTAGDNELTFGSQRKDKTPHLAQRDAQPHLANSEVPSHLVQADLIVRFDEDLGDFHVFKGDKKLSIHASLNEALASAERRALGTEMKILVDDGNGNLEAV